MIRCDLLFSHGPASRAVWFVERGRPKVTHCCSDCVEGEVAKRSSDGTFDICLGFQNGLSQIQEQPCKSNPTAVGDFADVAERNSTNSMKPTAVAVSGAAHD